MSTVFTLFMVLIMILSVLLIIVVMAQNPKGGAPQTAPATNNPGTAPVAPETTPAP